MSESPQSLLEKYVNQMIGKTIVGAGTTDNLVDLVYPI
jgi:hypothetical protein